MPKINLGALGLEVDAQPFSAITKYFRNILSLRPKPEDLARLVNIADTPLREVELPAVRLGLFTEQDIEVGNTGVEWTVEAGASVGVAIFNTPGEVILSGNQLGDGTEFSVPEGKAVVGLDLQARLRSEVGRGVGDLTFGFGGGTVFSSAYYCCLDAGTTLRQALGQALASWQIPGDWDDLAAMPEGNTMTVSGGGTLTFSIAGEFSSSANPLAVTLPVADLAVKVKAGGSVSLGADVEVTTEYEIRTFRSAGGRILLGCYRKEGAGVEITASAKAGVSVGAGTFDLTTQVIRAISSDARADEEFLQQSGLGKEQIELIEETIKAGVNRKLEASLDAAFKSLRSDEAAFLFRIDPIAIDEAGRSAVRRALDGDLRPLTSGAALQGVTLLRTIWTETQQKSSTIRINLFGIFNYISVSELLVQGKVLYELESGDIVITDSATATRVRASLLNTAADAEKLRKLLAESFLITAAYCGSRLLRVAPALTARHWYFEQHHNASRQVMKDYLDVPLALGLLSPEQQPAHLGDANRQGLAALYAETGYTPAVMRQLFFRTANHCRDFDEYVEAGRRALGLLVQSGDEDDERRLLATRADVWQAIESGGSGQNALIRLRELHLGLADHVMNAMYSDYLTIVNWAEAMVSLAKKIAEIDGFFDANPGGVDRDDKRLTKHRKELRERLAEAAKKTKEKFGDPWGLVAADLVSGRQASAVVQITTAHQSNRFERPA